MAAQPDDDQAVLGLAPVRGELGDWVESLRLYEAAAALKGAADWPISYRSGIAQQQLGRMEAAKASFSSYIAGGKGQKTSLDDARKRLAQLGG